MLKRAVASNPLVRLSTWETEQEGWSRTRLVLDAYADKLKAFSKSGRDEDRPDWLPGSVGTEEAAEAECREETMAAEVFSSRGRRRATTGPQGTTLRDTRTRGTGPGQRRTQPSRPSGTGRSTPP